jgi:DNA repair protein SbcD/Mre11
LRILCTADVHIGRRSTRLPAHLDGHAHSCGSAWSRIVDLAIAEAVDLVAIAGDLVDQANRYFEAIGTLEAGFRRLAAAGIPAVVVAGNHDHDVLPALVDSLPADTVRLLGRGGKWERMTLEGGGTRVHVDGWSFPHGHFGSSPLQGYQPAESDGRVLGLLHADLDQPGSRYAPVGTAELRRHPGVFFLLGHVHAPRTVQEVGGARFVYPGSPQAMDPGETGARGAALLEPAGSGWEVRQFGLSSVRYEELEVSVEGADDVAEVEARVVAAVREGLRSAADGSDHLRCLRYRVRLQGRTRKSREIEIRMMETSGDLELTEGGVTASIESVLGAMEPALNLESLAGGVGAPAILAQILRGEGIDPALRGDLSRTVREVHGSRSFLEVHDPDEVQELERVGMDELRRAATLLLDELLLQKEAE